MPNNNMTIKEAIIELNRCKVSGYMPTDWDRRCKAIDAAKAAVRKQEPMKPDPCAEGGDIECPTCGKVIDLPKSDRYCYFCGQRFDFGGDD